jgi:hypothetical protein
MLENAGAVTVNACFARRDWQDRLEDGTSKRQTRQGPPRTAPSRSRLGNTLRSEPRA